MTLSGVTTPNNARFNGGGTLTLCEGVTLGNRTTISNSGVLNVDESVKIPFNGNFQLFHIGYLS